MGDWFSGATPALAGVVLVAVAGARAFGSTGRARAGAVVVSGGSIAVVLAENVWILAGAWLLASVVARSPGAAWDLEPTPSTALAVLGDAVAVAALSAHALDVGDTRLPWADADAQVATWVIPVLAAGIALRVVSGATADPPVTVAAIVVAAQFAHAALPSADVGLVVVLAAVAPFAAGVTGWIPVTVLVALGTWGVQHPAATEAGTLALAGAAVATAVAGAAGIRARPATPGGRAAGGVRRLARLPARAAGVDTPVFLGLLATATVLLHVPAGDHPEVVLVVASALSVAALVAPALADRAAWAGLDVARGRAVWAVAVLGVVAALAVYVVPGPWAGVAGVADGSVEEVLRSGRGSLAWAVGFALAMSALIAGLAGRVGRVIGRPRPR